MQNLFKTSFLAVIPLIAPIWENQPPTSEELQTPRPILASDAAVQFQADGLQYVDQQLQKRFLHNFAATNNQQAAEIFLQIIEDQQDIDTMLVALSQLHRLPYARQRTARLVIPLLDHPDRRIRYWCHQLLGDLPITQKALSLALHTAGHDVDPNVRSAAWQALQAHNGHVAFEQVADLTQAENARQRSLAWTVAAAASNAREYEETLQLHATTDRSPLVRRAILLSSARTYPEFGQTLRQQMVEDPHASVRLAVAATARPLQNAHSDVGEEAPADQDLLIQLTEDSDHEVRRIAIKSLARFPNPQTLAAVTARFSDENVFVRIQAENTTVELAALMAVADRAVLRLTDSDQEARLHAFNVLGRIASHRHAPDILAQLPEEPRDRNIAAAITALGRLEHRPALPAVTTFFNHDSRLVREAVAAAFGRIGDPSINQQLISLILDSDLPVRLAAITSAGRLRHPEFSQPLLTILEDTRKLMPEYTAEDRIAACWAAPRLQPIPTTVMSRIAQHATRRVVASEMGPMYDMSEVMAAAVFAFAEAARHENSYEEEWRNINGLFTRAAQSPATDEFVGQVVGSPILTDIVRQAEAWQAGQTIAPHPAPTSQTPMLYEQLAR